MRQILKRETNITINSDVLRVRGTQIERTCGHLNREGLHCLCVITLKSCPCRFKISDWMLSFLRGMCAADVNVSLQLDHGIELHCIVCSWTSQAVPRRYIFRSSQLIELFRMSVIKRKRRRIRAHELFGLPT